MAVETVGEFLADEVPEQQSARVDCGTSSWISARPSGSPPRSRSMTRCAPAARSPACSSTSSTGVRTSPWRVA